MKKILKTILCLVVCVCLLSTSLSIAVYAESTMPVQNVENLLAESTNFNEATPMYEETEGEDRNHTLSMEDLTFIDEGQLPIDTSSEDSSAVPYSLKSSLYTESADPISLAGFASTSPDFTDIAAQEDLKDAMGCSDDYYLGLQGGCFDGTYYYYGFLMKNSIGDTVDAGIVWGKMNTNGSLTNLSGMRNLLNTLHHINDMTYNKDTGEIVIACCETGYHHVIYTISAGKLRNHERTFSPHYISCMVTAIDYNPTRTQYVAAISGRNNAFAILDTDFQLIKTIGYSKNSTNDTKLNWATQGIYVDNQYIYRLYYLYEEEEGTNSYANDPDSRLRVFDWDGNYVKTYNFKTNKSTTGEKRIYESENLFVAGDRFMVAFSCVPKVNGQTERRIAYYDLSEIMFHAQFCPDENISEYKNDYDNDNHVYAMMFYGVTAPLRKFRVQKDGKKFTGWTAYRVEQNKWYYHNADDTDRAWYKEGSQPSGYTKFIYKDKANVSKTGAKGGHVLLCAQWESTSKYTVSFMKNGATSGTMDDQSITYGTSTALRANAYTKGAFTFQFWNAYWSEKNKWYYQNADGTTKGWYKEGYEPAGYTKYVYNNKQNVSKTVYKGSHVYMYAVWNEYYVQYNANGATVAYTDILEQHTAEYASGAQNGITPFDNSKLYVNKSTYYNTCLLGYNLYRREIDKWMYISVDDGTKKWYKLNQNPNNYELYERARDSNMYLGATAQPGEHLILYAVWGYS